MHLGLRKVNQIGPNAFCLLLSTNSLLHTRCGCSAPSAPPTWTLLPLSLPGRQKVLIFRVHLKKWMWFYVPGCCECTQRINCITDLRCSYCSLHVQMASSEVFACWPFFSSQLQHGSDLNLLVSYRERRETGGERCKLSYEHMRKKEKDPLLKSIELWWFIPPANQLLHLQKRAVKGRPGQLERIQLFNSPSAPFLPRASFAKAAGNNPSSQRNMDCGGCWCMKQNTS